MKTPQNTLLLQAIGECIDLVRTDIEREQEKKIGGSKYTDDGVMRQTNGRRKHKFSWKLFKEEVFGLKSAQQRAEETYYEQFDDIQDLDTSSDEDDAGWDGNDKFDCGDDITEYSRSTASLRSRMSSYSHVTVNDTPAHPEPSNDYDPDEDQSNGGRDSNLEWLFQS